MSGAPSGLLKGELGDILRVRLREPSMIYDRLRTIPTDALKRKRSQRSASNGQQGFQQKMLTWDVFSSCASASSKKGARARDEIKPRYHAFIKLVQSVVGECPSDELHYSAYLFLKALCTPPPSSGKFSVRKELEKYFGALSNPVYAQFVSMSQELKAWREANEAPSESLFGRSGASSSSKEEKSNEAALFGDNLSFTSVLNFNEQPSDWNPTPNYVFDEDVEEEEEKGSHRPSSTSSSTTSSGNTNYSMAWLVKQCEKFASFSPSGEILVSEDQLAAGALRLLQSKSSSEAIQSELLNLIGFDGIEFIGNLIQNRKQIVAGCRRKPSTNARAGSSSGSTTPHNPHSTFSVNHQNAIAANKRNRKMEKKMYKRSQAAQDEIDPDRLDEQASEFKAHISTKVGLPGAQKGIALPKGTTRTHFQKYEEVYIPPVIPPPLEKSKLVPVTVFDDFSRIAFRGITHLNRMQSKVYPVAYKTNENMLVCAPTGAGKTNVALMTVMHEVNRHVEDGVLRKDRFKIVYVAPMKALAQEVTDKFSKVLAPLGIVCKELTGDTQLTKREIEETQIIVTTPEKWDVVTRKSGDGSLMPMVKLLIIDEVHLLHEDRGSVIEIIVARTLRHVESSQTMCRIVGLSATLPNYADVAGFLRVNPTNGLFFFGNEYRPVPLTQFYLGVKGKNMIQRKRDMIEIALEKTQQSVADLNQVMVFVHSRKDTVGTARAMIELAGELEFCTDENPKWERYRQKVARLRNKDLKDLLKAGFGCHHAGMVRSERTLVEELFREGLVTVLCCTATLAWGVNLPAHTVIIKGTKIYDAKRGGFVELSMLDVMQIFGRAGRPQYDTTGEGIIITEHDQLNHYLTLLNHQLPIESTFIKALPDHLNAEIILGTVTNLSEAIEWLGYTYLFVRMLRNPMAYGITYADKAEDPHLFAKRKQLIEDAAKALMKSRMVRYDRKSGNFFSTDVGRVASHYYINHESVETYNAKLRDTMNDDAVLDVLTYSHEFQNIKVRDEETESLLKMSKKFCPVKIREKVDTEKGKVNVLLQTFISNGFIDSGTLVSDSHYISQSAGRISRALFEMALRSKKSALASHLLQFTKMFDRRIWHFQHPLRQFSALKVEHCQRLEELKLGIDELVHMDANEIGEAIRQQRLGSQIMRYVRQIPYLEVETRVQPITRDVVKITLDLYPEFDWNPKVHGSVEPFHIWVEGPDNMEIFHAEYFLLHHKKAKEMHQLELVVPVSNPAPSQYFVRVVSDRWLGSESVYPISFKQLILPDDHPPHTKLLPLTPLPVSALYNEGAQKMYKKFTHFNSVQTQVFHVLYHTDENVLLGAPTGSGKTIVGELAMLRLFGLHKGKKVVYIAPMKALAREKLEDWNKDTSFAGCLGTKVVMLTGDSTPDARALRDADVLITTPEKWDGVSRSWKTRGYVKQVGLVLIDEIHLLGQDRGPILEVIVSRTRYISSQLSHNIRIVGLSTALSNARDLADWLGIPDVGFFNFPPDVRPVPLSVHISGYPGKHYCPRMLSMNKPTYAAITTYSPGKPVLVFVSSRRQTRLTALDLITYSTADGSTNKFLRMDPHELTPLLDRIRDKHLAHMLQFGIGMHHAGLAPSDRKIVEELFVNQKILVLVCTSTLAWGVNFPAHLVVVKGTEYYDAKTCRYVDFPITDVLQMMGRAGRPQYDKDGVACVLVHEPKKNFYLKFLHSPFPVESSLHKEDNLHNHFNAEICGGTISSVQDAVEYLTWTFFFRRLVANPTYYGLEGDGPDDINDFLLGLIRSVMMQLAAAGCIEFHAEKDTAEAELTEGIWDSQVSFIHLVSKPKLMDSLRIVPTSMGKVASGYYLKYKTVSHFRRALQKDSSLEDLLNALCLASEFDEFPVRHNEDLLNEAFDKEMQWEIQEKDYGSPFTKVNMLFQAHFARLPLPHTDYVTDTMSALDQSMRILQAMVDITSEKGWYTAARRCMLFTQMIVQGRWATDSGLSNLPHMSDKLLKSLKSAGVSKLFQLPRLAASSKLADLCSDAGLGKRHTDDLCKVAARIPDMSASITVNGKRQGRKDVARVEHGQECTVQVHLNRNNKTKDIRAYAPKFSKAKDEGWWLVVGSPAKDDLVAMKRLTVQRQTVSTLSFQAPFEVGMYDYEVSILSDSYIGIDRVLSFRLEVTK